MRRKKQKYCVILLVFLSSCYKYKEDALVLFETQGGGSSIVIENQKLYLNPIIENGLVSNNESGDKILYYRDKKNAVVCHNFGHGFVIANFKGASANCFGWKFERKAISNNFQYVSYCDETKNCPDKVFQRRPFLQYVLNSKSELIRFKFDPKYGDATDYMKKGDGKYIIK